MHQQLITQCACIDSGDSTAREKLPKHDLAFFDVRVCIDKNDSFLCSILL